MPAVHRNTEPVAVVTSSIVERLKQDAETAPFRRSRLNLHRSDDSLLHEMIIAFCKDSLVCPHRHCGKSESFHVIEGELEVVFFDDEGNVDNIIRLAEPGREHPSIYRLSEPLWHSVVILSDKAVVHEVTLGPFDSSEHNEASWAPYDDDELRSWLADRISEFRQKAP